MITIRRTKKKKKRRVKFDVNFVLVTQLKSQRSPKKKMREREKKKGMYECKGQKCM